MWVGLMILEKEVKRKDFCHVLDKLTGMRENCGFYSVFFPEKTDQQRSCCG
jgi:hypothetical protein